MNKFTFLFYFFCSFLHAQNEQKTCATLNKINVLLQREHYSPKPIDDSLAVFVIDNFIDELDENRSLFTNEDFEKLSKHRLTLDNSILERNCSFISDFQNIYKNALARKVSILEKIQNETFDYNSTESLKFSKTKFPFVADETELVKIWRKRVRYNILEEISKMSNKLDTLQTNFLKFEKVARTKIFETLLCKITSILEQTPSVFNANLDTILFNLFCTYFDPHTNYFSNEARDSFMSSLSTSNLSIGLNVGLNDNEEIVVEEVVPSGPAAKSKQIVKEDIITKVSNNKGESYIVSCSSLNKIGALIFADTNLEIELTLRSKDGTIKTVLLEKQEMKADSYSVYSFLAEKQLKVGYINIPSFYSDFDNYSAKGCSQDVAKEIFKLKKDNISGLVIDLQNNGGGSMEEAVKLAGMFVENGPISVLTDKYQRQTAISDTNKRVVFDGPIVILINQNSASASEFFCGAMQDYNRAVVVGVPSLGKASMQVIMPIEEENDKDFVKVSIQKFYRITGNSSQIKGIVPDVFAPVLFDSISQKEQSFKTALPFDTIKTNLKFNTFDKTKIDNAAVLSKVRVKNSTWFKEIEDINSELNCVYFSPKSPIKLDLINVFNDTHDIDWIWYRAKKLETIETACKISASTVDFEKNKNDIYLNEIQSFRLKVAKANPYLEEAINILYDLSKAQN